jgi:hypothetical protein
LDTYAIPLDKFLEDAFGEQYGATYTKLGRVAARAVQTHPGDDVVHAVFRDLSDKFIHGVVFPNTAKAMQLAGVADPLMSHEMTVFFGLFLALVAFNGSLEMRVEHFRNVDPELGALMDMGRFKTIQMHLTSIEPPDLGSTEWISNHMLAEKYVQVEKEIVETIRVLRVAGAVYTLDDNVEKARGKGVKEQGFTWLHTGLKRTACSRTRFGAGSLVPSLDSGLA